MSVEKFPLDQNLVRQLFELANTPFTLDRFAERWNAFGWSHKQTAHDEFGFRVKITDELSLLVAPHENRIAAAILPFCWWEGYNPQFRSDLQEHQREHAAFDAAFQSTTELTTQVLSTPFAH